VSLGDLTLYSSAIFAVIAAASSIHRLSGRRIDPRLPRVLAIIAGVLSTITMVFLFRIFLTTDLGFEIVHSYSSADLPTIYRLSSSWAGQAGSMVLWSSFLVMAWAIEEVRWWWRSQKGTEPSDDEPSDDGPSEKKRRGRKGRSREQKSLGHKLAVKEAAPPEGWLTLDVARVVVMAIAILLLIVTLSLDPFQARESLLPEGGRSLNPALRTPLMAIHPPIVFLAYAFMTIPFAASLAYVLRGDNRWVDISRRWARVSWLTLTLGIGIGGMWAYETLGWGGYWAWDPVETSSLVPWIALTAFMHTQVQHERTGEYRYLAPFLAGFGLFLVLFATFVTRSGVWASVHAYAGASEGTTLERVSEVLGGSPSLTWIYSREGLGGAGRVPLPHMDLLGDVDRLLRRPRPCGLEDPQDQGRLSPGPRAERGRGTDGVVGERQGEHVRHRVPPVDLHDPHPLHAASGD
jgi:cytochrome c-type biogenesis protein CcmF